MPVSIPAEYCAAFRPSANRRHLWGGAEPKLLLSCFYAGWMIAFSFPHWYGLLAAIATVLFLRGLARRLAKIDPYFTEVYQESFRYDKSFYTRWPQEAGRKLVLSNRNRRTCSSKQKQEKRHKA